MGILCLALSRVIESTQAVISFFTIIAPIVPLKYHAPCHEELQTGNPQPLTGSGVLSVKGLRVDGVGCRAWSVGLQFKVECLLWRLTDIMLS